jgi:tRNA dimethylallyltransferase
MGPTASGKTRLAIDLAQACNGEIISVDSALVYRGMDIGTAKPMLAERDGVPHHLIDVLDPSEAYSTGQFHQDALALMEAIARRGRVPILAGGTMLYFNGLFHGLAKLPPANPVIRAEIDNEARQRGWDRLHADLAAIDPMAAARIHPNDPQRIQRALEVYRITGIPLSALLAVAQPSLRYRLCKLVLAPAGREALHARIRTRFQDMIERGLIDEVRGLRERGDLHAGLPAIRAVGYRQVWAYLEGQYGRDELVERGVIATRQFAKRQLTWLRRETDAARYETEDPRLMDKILRDLSRLIEGPA